MNAVVDIPEHGLAELILQAVDRLHSEGFFCWIVDDAETVAGTINVQLEGFPDELPITEAELQLLAGVLPEVQNFVGAHCSE